MCVEEEQHLKKKSVENRYSLCNIDLNKIWEPDRWL